MASTTTYGDFPGVKVTTAGGAITGVAVGREQKLIIIANGDESNGDADVNAATQVNSPADADRKFGEGTELAEQMKDALGNGANISFLYGVIPEEVSVTAESFTSDSGTLANAPIIEDKDLIAVRGNPGGTPVDLDIEFDFEKPPTDPGDDDDTAYINPITGEVTFDSAETDFEVDYSYLDISAARDEAQSVIGDEETAIIGQCVENESLATDLSSSVNTLRGEYKMAMGLQAAEPTGPKSDDDTKPDYDTGSYTDSIDNDAMFLHAPARKEDSKTTITGALGGLMAGSALGPGGSIYNESLTTDNLENRLSKADTDNLQDAQVIPVRQPPQGGSIKVSRNLSTSTEEDWVRDYWTRRIVDQVILITKSVGDSIIGRINDVRTRETVETTLKSELKGLSDDRLITDAYSVSVYQVDANTVGIDVGITPQGIVKRVDISITIDA